MQGNFKTIWHQFGHWRQAPCERFEKDISLYADGLANARQAARVEQHIATCAGCKAHLAAIRATSGALSMQPEPVLPQGLSERLRLAIQDERRTEQARIAGRAKTRVLAPRWALAGAVGSVALAAAIVSGTHLLTSSNLPAANHGPARVALAPSANHSAPSSSSKLLPAPPEKIASAQTGERATHNAPLTAIIRRPQPAQVVAEHGLPRVAEATAPPRSVTTAWHAAPKRTVSAHPVMVAKTPVAAPKSPISGDTFPIPHPRAPRSTSSEQIAALPPQGPASHDTTTATPPAVNSSNSGEQPVQVAQLPASVPAQTAVATGPARIRLASRLKIVDTSAQAAQVAISEERPVDYTGSLSIVGSSIR